MKVAERVSAVGRNLGAAALLAVLTAGSAFGQRPVKGEVRTLEAEAPPPAPALGVYGSSPAFARVAWSRVSGVTSYLVIRKQTDRPDKAVKLSSTHSAPGEASGWTYWDDPGLQPATSYTYSVGAVYPDGRAGFADFQYTTPPLENPSGFAAKQTGNGQVELSWHHLLTQPVNGGFYFVVFGPGSAQGGLKVNGTTSTSTVTVTGVPSGVINEWSVGTYYEPGPLTSPAAAFPRVQLMVNPPPPPPPVVSGRYLVTITGLRAIWASFDDQLSRDGMGDEVYAAAYIRRYDRRNGAMKDFAGRRTMTYGDTKGFGTTRVQAGTRSGTGGIRDTDPIPANSDPTLRSLPPSDIAFPLKLFEGTLTDGDDALVISPSLWEEDGFTQQYLNWSQQMATISPALFARPEIQGQITGGRFGQLLFGSSLLNDGTADLALWQVNLMTGLLWGKQLFEGVDRAIGILRSGTNDLIVPNSMVVLTREIIEAGLAPLPPHTIPFALPVAWPRMPKPGVIMIPFVDGRHNIGVTEIPPARYELYLTVERLP